MTLKRQIAIGWAATLFLGIIGVAGLDGRAQVPPSRPMPPTTQTPPAGRAGQSTLNMAPGGDSPVARRSAWRARNG